MIKGCVLSGFTRKILNIGWLGQQKRPRSQGVPYATRMCHGCYRSALLKHCSTQVHLKNLKSKLNTASIKDVFQQQSIKKDYRENTVVQISAFIAEHNLPFALANPLLSLIQSSAPTDLSEKTVLSQIHLNATKCTNIRQGTGLYFANMPTKKCKKLNLV